MASLTRRSRLTLAPLAAAGALVVIAARALLPLAPPVYDGISVAPQPFRYVSPPPDLASTNKPPLGGQSDLLAEGSVNKLGTVQTDDQQVLAFFPKGALSAAGPLTIKITPEANPPPPPSGNALVGNVYGIEVVQAGASQPALAKPAQVLLRIPPHKLSSVQVFYGAAWHQVQWGAQQDYLNLTLDHLGLVGALDDGRHSQSPPPQPSPGFNLVGAIEAALVLIAIVIVVAAIVVQRRGANASARGSRRKR